MRIYLVGQYNSGNGLVQQRALAAERAHHILLSYAYMPRAERLNAIALREAKPRLLIDSGAFTAHSTGRSVSVEAYADWIDGFRARWPMLADLAFISLDVIGDQGATWKNTVYLQKRGHTVLPVVTGDAREADVERALEYDWCCFGGFGAVPRGPDHRARMVYLLDARFRTVTKLANRFGRFPKVHLLGMTKVWATMRYPAFSVDSSSWIQPVQYGFLRTAGKRHRVPRINARSTGPDVEAMYMALREEIRYMMRMQDQATAFWTSRGVTFDGEA